MYPDTSTTLQTLKKKSGAAGASAFDEITFMRTITPCGYTMTWLSNVESVNLSNCIYLSDVSPLRKIKKVKLSGCLAVQDVSALSECHDLDLSRCVLVKDVSALANCHTLILDGCCNVRDVTMLGGVYSLSLAWCFQIEDVSCLGNVHSLNLTRCIFVDDVGKLGRVHDLNISKCPLITDVSALGKVHTLNVKSCYFIRNLDTIRNSVAQLIENHRPPRLVRRERKHVEEDVKDAVEAEVDVDDAVKDAVEDDSLLAKRARFAVHPFSSELPGGVKEDAVEIDDGKEESVVGQKRCIKNPPTETRRITRQMTRRAGLISTDSAAPRSRPEGCWGRWMI